LTDVVNAGDVNIIYGELKAVTDTLGVTPNKRLTAWGSDSFTSGATTWTTVYDRITNVEAGTYTAFNDRVKSSGGSSIVQTVVSSAVNLTVQAYSTQTSNLFEAKNTAGTPITYITKDGTFRTTVIDGGSA